MEFQKILVDGQTLYALTAAERDELLDRLDEVWWAANRDRILAEADTEDRIPGEVVHYELADGMHPLAAWRKYREMTQAELAAASGITQATIARIEGDTSRGRLATRKALAKALDAPLWAISRDEE